MPDTVHRCSKYITVNSDVCRLIQLSQKNKKQSKFHLIYYIKKVITSSSVGTIEDGKQFHCGM